MSNPCTFMRARNALCSLCFSCWS
uniref:Uncharacterized protein n=1 Tax=Anguilla anguilla TaxID=7936 RepID=A0A0E9S738_ANGAN